MEPLQITAEQQLAIDTAAKLLPDGYQIFSVAQVREVVERKNNLEFVFKKLKPIFEILTSFNVPDGENPMAVLAMAAPKIMPAFKQLQTDEELKTKMAEVIATI